MNWPKIRLSHQKIEVYLFLLLSIALFFNSLFFVSREIHSIDYWAVLTINQVFAVYFLLFIGTLVVLFYKVGKSYNQREIIEKMILVIFPSAVVLAYGFSQSVHFNCLLKFTDYLFFIFSGLYLIYRYKKYRDISDFVAEIFFKWKKINSSSFRTQFLKNIPETFLVLSVMILFLIFGGTYLAKHAAVDEPLWTHNRIIKFWNNVQDGEYEKTMISDKPGITVAIISGIGLHWINPLDYKDPGLENVNISEFKNIEKMYWALRLPVFLFNLLMLPIFFFFIKKLANKKTALASIILIFLSPLLLGISTIINPDSLLWTFLPLSILSYLLYLKENTNKFLYWAGIFLGLSILTKYISNILYLFFFCLIFLNYIINYSLLKKDDVLAYFQKSLLDYFTLVLFSLLTCFAFLPAAWIDISRLPEITLLSKPFSRLWVPYLVIVTLVLLDVFSNKARLILFLSGLFVRFRKSILVSIFVFFILASIFVLVTTWDGMKIYDFEKIMSSPKSSYMYERIVGLFLANFYPLVFGLTPISLIFLVVALIAVSIQIMRSGIKSEHTTVFFLVLFIIVYYAASTVSNVSATVRYQIVIYPLLVIIASFGITYVINLFKINQRLTGIMFYIGMIALSSYSLYFIKPFYLSYASELLPQKYILNPQDMGDGSYEAAQYLNSLPDANHLNIWTDKRGVCVFFLGSCHSGFDLNKDEIRFDYYVVSSGRQDRSTAMNKRRPVNVNIHLLYDSPNYDFKLEIGKRPNNYVKIFSANKVQNKLYNQTR